MIDYNEIMLDISTNILLVVDKDMRVIDCNRRAFLTFNKTKVKGVKLQTLYGKSLCDKLFFYAQKASQSNLPVSFVLNIKKRLFDCRIYPYDFGWAFYFDDITELSNRSNALNEFVSRMDIAQNVTSIGYFELDLINNQSFFTKEIYSLLGVEKNNNDTSNLLESHIYNRDINKYNKYITKLVHGADRVSFDIRFKTSAGEIINCHINARMLCVQRCKIVGTIQDFSEVVDTRNTLKTAKSKAQDLSKARLYFITQAAHDLRQPIQALRMFVYALSKESLTDKQLQLSLDIDAAVENLSYLLDNIIDISRLDYVDEKYNSSLFDLSSVIDKVVLEYDIIAEKNSIEFIVEQEDVEMYSNPLFVERIIRNLLNNAFKYTKDKVMLKIAKTDHESVLISVEDNGIGIASKELDVIFDKFSQGKYFGTSKEGLGLGLSVVKKMTNLLGGRITVQTELKKGSTFMLELPLAKNK